MTWDAKTRDSQTWDLVIRITHWLVAGIFLANFWWLEEGDDPHEWAGYAMMGLLLIRWIWGYIGPSNARFKDFWPTPKRVKHSLDNFAAEHQVETHEARHTPLAGIMVIGLWLGLLVVGFSGWLQETDQFWGEEWVQLLHEWSANLVMAAVVIHISAVLLIQHKYRLPLVRNMLTGR